MTTATSPYRVVVAIDFTGTSLPAFAHGLRLVQTRPGAELHLVHVLWKSPPSREEMARDDARLDDAYRRLRSFAMDHQSATEGQPQQRVWYHARIGDPAEGIHQVAIDVDADLIVVGTSDPRGVERILLGSVAEKVTRIARLPVLVARRKNLGGLTRSPVPDPPRPGENLHEKRPDMIRSSELVAFESALADTHIAGMI